MTSSAPNGHASTSSRPLFGGALSTSLPGNVIDASDLRQVPDTQEVFVFPDSDMSIMVEILQIVTEGAAATDLREAARFHFNSIAHDNAALSSSIDNLSSPFPLPSTASTSTSQRQHLYCTIEGTQTVSKFNLGADEADLVKLFLAVIRVDLEDTASAPTEGETRRGGDITIAVNVPLGKASALDRDELGSMRLSQEARTLEIQAKEAFHRAVQDFKVVDYDLFA